jgi:diacylglycerol kinase (ATP)
MGRTVAVVLNPKAGKGTQGHVREQIVDGFRRRGVEARILVGDSAEHASELASKAVAGGVDAIVAAGGDGTVNTALQAVAETETPLGLLPLGTGNDNARLLGIPAKDPEGAIDVISMFRPRTVDVASVTTADGTSRYFLGVLSAGFDALVTERANNLTWPKGDLRYVLAMLQEIRSFSPCAFTLEIDGKVHTDRSYLVAVGNGVYYGGGMRICEGAVIDDGLLQLTWLHNSSKWHFVSSFPKVFKGTHVTDSAVTQHVAREVRISAAGQISYADGDRMGDLPITVRVHPGGLRVLTSD